MFDLPAVRECLWWQNFTASEGIEAGLCRQIAVSVEVTCALKCSQIWWLNSLLSQELEVGFWYRSVWESSLSCRNKTVSVTILDYSWCPVYSSLPKPHPAALLLPYLSRTREKMKKFVGQVQMGISLTNYCHGEDRLNLG